jgi:histone acetyltransferase
LGFINRDVGAKVQEERREIVFKIIKNDQQKESLKMLIDLKNIFSRQLPKMPK